MEPPDPVRVAELVASMHGIGSAPAQLLAHQILSLVRLVQIMDEDVAHMRSVGKVPGAPTVKSHVATHAQLLKVMEAAGMLKAQVDEGEL